VAGELLEPARFIGLNPQQPQLQLRGCPGELHGLVDGGRVAVFLQQRQHPLAALPRRQDQRQLHAF